jgi:hypothetical protein
MRRRAKNFLIRADGVIDQFEQVSESRATVTLFLRISISLLSSSPQIRCTLAFLAAVML